MSELAGRLTVLQERITSLEARCHRPLGSVTLLAVSKKQSIEKIREAALLGQRLFGENYLQEALDKIPHLAELALEWHFIGQLQSNKTRPVAEHFSWVHSVSSLKLAQRLNEQRPSHLPPLNICIQVNLGPDDARNGIDPKDLLALAQHCVKLPNIRLRGLMALPVLTKDITQQRAAFRQLVNSFHALQHEGFPVDTVSAGTTEDLESAIAEGSTLVRIGTALFGPR